MYVISRDILCYFVWGSEPKICNNYQLNRQVRLQNVFVKTIHDVQRVLLVPSVRGFLVFSYIAGPFSATFRPC